MKSVIKSIIITICLVFGGAYSFKKLTVDVAQEASKHVSAFKTLRNDRIYATGFHLKYKNKVYLISNKHVCISSMILTNSKLARVDNHIVKILHISDQADLCILESWRKEGLEVASKDVNPLDKIILIGHPRGLPLTVREGRMVGEENICLLTRKSKNRVGMECYDANRISATAYPGNSGSPVLNSDGQVVGVLFAGSSAYPHEPFIVPLEELKLFLLINLR